MKTLYLTDLDGTFLNDNAEISKRSCDIINYLIDNGVNFTLSTARTYATVVPMFKNVRLNLPLVLMNGVCIYDPIEHKTVEYYPMSAETGRKILDVFAFHKKSPLLYFENDSRLIVEYTELANKAEHSYVSQREHFFNKQFVKVEEYSVGKRDNLLFAVFLDEKEKIESLYNDVSKISEVSCNFYPDNYTGFYFLEIFANGISKLSGAARVKALTGCDKIVAFGDNINDLQILSFADESYAVENANELLKKAATGVIGKNTDDAVARFLLERFENGKI